MDIDDFKYINDQYGHMMGDKGLCILADLLNKTFEEIGIVGRYGGDEFLVALKDGSNFQKTKQIILHFQKEIKEAFHESGLPFDTTVSCGTTFFGGKMRKDYETEKNENGDFAKQAAECMSKVGTGTVAYKSYKDGKLPKAHITARASRWAQKIFLSHLFEEMYRVKYDKVPPRYYSLEHCDGHHDEIKPEVPYTKVSSEK